MRLNFLVFVLVITGIAVAQDRHGPSNGTVKELPTAPVNSVEATATPAPLLIHGQGLADPEVSKIKSDYRARQEKLLANVDQADAETFKQLTRESQLLSYEMDLEILERFRETAIERQDADAIKRIDESKEKLESVINQYRLKRDLVPLTKSAAKVQESKSNGEQSTSREGGTR